MFVFVYIHPVYPFREKCGSPFRNNRVVGNPGEDNIAGDDGSLEFDLLIGIRLPNERISSMKELRYSVTVVGVLILIAFGTASGQTTDATTDCIEKTVETKKYRERVCTSIQARAKAPGINGGTRRASARGCITATPGYSIIGAPEVTQLSCIDGRCAHDPIEIASGGEGITSEVCVTVRAWSDSSPFGGGGYGRYSLCATVEQPFTADSVIEIIRKCREANTP